MNLKDAKKSFLEAAEIMAKFNIKFHLSDGTMLGAIRDKGFISWDYDIDNRVAAADWDVSIIKEFEKNGFRCFRSLNRRLYGDLPSGFDFIKRDIDIGFGLNYYYPPEDLMVFLAGRPIVGAVQPASFYRGNHFIDFLDIKVRIPYPPGKYLILHYGKNWRIPEKGKGYLVDRKPISIEKYVKYFHEYPEINKKKEIIPIFIITCDRLEVLKKSIQSYYDYIKTPFEIVIVDFGSTYEPTVKFLKQLESEKVKVYRKEKINIPSDLNKVNEAVQDYFKGHLESNYIITDPDIALDNVGGDIFDVYSYLLEKLPNVNVVGPMLRIDDIPDYYPEKKRLINGEKGCHKRFHSSKIDTIQYKDKDVKYVFAPIDTTFGMYRKGKSWRRLMNGIRVLSPYSARHLDWYLDPKNLTQDQKYYIEHASKQIAHWSLWEK